VGRGEKVNKYDEEFEIICLSDIEPEHTETVQVRNGKFLCSECGKAANAFHWSYSEKRWYTACPDLDPGEYWFSIEDLAENTAKWLWQLCHKTDGRLIALIEYLGYEGACALDGYNCKHSQ
jgi:hypothetical protein